jgi:hypothetical protein
MKKSKGVILPMTILFMGFFSAMGLGALQLSGTLGQSSVQYTSSTQAFWLAEAGAVEAKEALKAQIRTTLSSTLNATAITTVAANCSSYLNAQTPLALLSTYGGFTGGTDKVTLADMSTISLGSGRQGTYNATVTIIPDPAHAGSNPQQSAANYTFYYKYSISSAGNVANTTPIRTIKLGDGTFVIRVQKENFARYGLFTSVQIFDGGAEPVWFTSSTHYTGPIHTNDRFNFAGIPGGIFDGLVTQSLITARFYNNGSNVFLDCDQNPCVSSGLVNAGAWSNAFTYTINNYVTYNSVIYRGLQTNNRNEQPDAQTTWWRPQFLSWDNTVSYDANDYVVFDSVTYRCLFTNTNKQPDTQTAYWVYAQGTDVPRFNQGFLRGQAVINLPTDGTTKASAKTEALGTAWNSTTSYITDNVVAYLSGNNVDVYRALKDVPSNNKPDKKGNKYWSNDDGVYVPNVGDSVTGGIYIKGDACMTMGVTSNNPVYYIRLGGSPNNGSSCQGGTLTTVTVNNAAPGTTVSGSTTKTYGGIPDGITESGGTLIYATGNIAGFAGTIEQHTVLTVMAVNDIVITGHVRYEVPPSASNENVQNLLGLISWTGNIRVGVTAPDNLVIHGVLMAPTGSGLYVDSYNSGGVRGTVSLLGGLVAQTYGVVGTFNGQGQLTGYGRDFAYDSRMSDGKEPLYYPYTGKYIATDRSGGSSGLDASLPWQEN